MKEKFKIFFLVFITLLALVSCKKNENLTINASLVVSNLSDEDFSSIGTKNVAKSDFKKVIFIFDMNHNDKISERTISIPIFKKVVNSYDNVKRYWFGKDTTIDNISENYAYYESNFILFTRNLSKDEIANIFHSENISISYMENDENKEEIINLKKIIKFE
ncbi:hypothetical protein [Anaerocolumna sp.]|uniref:hypothetical protein n=1 Tax=Anaerocolumna sp. TaxID=2041569 RepID=UPI0028ACC8AD|nr:hypothetical protein [Anaerocolumna sp.]